MTRSLSPLSFIALLIFFLVFSLPVQGSSIIASIRNIAFREQATPPIVQADLGIPARLKIPKIAVDATLESVGMTPQGVMDAPKNPADAAWFNLGPRPGEKGSAVISGHYGWKNNTPAVFDKVHTLQRGDTLSVTDDRGVTTVFVVREFKIYNQNEDASAVFHSSDGKAHLNLITCEGVWDATLKSYSHRLVVFADRVVH